ncbi:hypothetical protein GA0115235_11505 [Streptomyces sp. DpondAA-F4a]|nr:hypothetical protein GA0115235_11505 [Streptomyces sp. DpondAA-F4a]
MHADAGTDGAQRPGEVHGAGPLVGVLAQAALYDRPQRFGDVARPAGLLAEVPVQDLQRGAACERRAARDQFVQQDARAVDVHGGGLRTALGGLGCHVGGRADELVGPGQSRGVGQPRDAEVGEHRVHLAVALVEQHVGGLQVAVDDAVGVTGGERVRDLGGEQGGGDRGERTVLPEVAVQVGTVDQVHHQGEQVALDDEVPGAHDVRVGEPQQHGALTQEAHHDVRVVGQLLLEHLDRHGLAGLAGDGRLGPGGLTLAGSPDGARGTAPERLLEQVLAAYRPHVMRSLLIVVLGGPPARPDVPAHSNDPVHGGERAPDALRLRARGVPAPGGRAHRVRGKTQTPEDWLPNECAHASEAGPSRHFCTHTRPFMITKRSPPGVLSLAGARMPPARSCEAEPRPP